MSLWLDDGIIEYNGYRRNYAVNASNESGESMYTANHVIPLFLRAFPEWKSSLKDEKMPGVDDIPGIYNKLSILAQYIVDAYKVGKTDDFPKLFNTLELLIREGDEKARELIMIGFIEVLQSIALNETFGLDSFKPWLKEESLRSWNEIAKFWKGKNPPGRV